LVSSPVDP
jgi:hypothetical protein